MNQDNIITSTEKNAAAIEIYNAALLKALIGLMVHGGVNPQITDPDPRLN
jgi:hypothetical protein